MTAPVVEEGKTYINGSSVFRCMQIRRDGSAVMCNVQTGWTLVAHNITERPSGGIEWSHSTDGHFDDVAHLRAQVDALDDFRKSVEEAAKLCKISENTQGLLDLLLERIGKDKWNLTFQLCSSSNDARI